MKETKSLHLMCKMLGGLTLQPGLKELKPTHSNWTASGSECVIEFEAQWYKVTVTPVVLEKT